MEEKRKKTIESGCFYQIFFFEAKEWVEIETKKRKRVESQCFVQSNGLDSNNWLKYEKKEKRWNLVIFCQMDCLYSNELIEFGKN